MSEARPTEAVMRLLNHLEHLMDIGVLTEDSIPVDMWNDPDLVAIIKKQYADHFIMAEAF